MNITNKLQFITVYSKIMVAVGYTINGLSDNVEVIDLENPEMICQDLPDYPFALYGVATFLNFNEEPEICGGADDTYHQVMVNFLPVIHLLEWDVYFYL